VNPVGITWVTAALVKSEKIDSVLQQAIADLREKGVTLEELNQQKRLRASYPNNRDISSSDAAGL